jgi:hypothetical protein
MNKGDRIALLSMPDDPDPIPPGTKGTVLDVQEIGSGEDRWFQVNVKWDDGRTLMLSVPPDRIEKETEDEE